MAITKPPVLPAWAESGDRVTPSNAEIQVGWPLSSIPPSRQRFNWLLNYLANAVRYFSRRGIPDYDAAETYMIGDRIIGDDGKTYRSLIDTNLAQTPSTSPTKWELWALTQAQADGRSQNNVASIATAAGTADAITGAFALTVTALTNGITLYVRTASANATTTPTFKADGTAAKTIVKGNGLALSAGDIAGGGHWIELQYDATLDKWVLLNPATGVSNTAPTPPQFDATLKVATMQALQRALGNLQSIYASNGTLALTQLDCGKLIVGNVAGTITLPSGGATASGAVILVQSIVAGVVVARNGADTIFPGVGSLTSITLGVGDWCAFTWFPGYGWAAYGSATLQYSSQFALSVASPGYQKLPGGLILQWGSVTTSASADVAVTFPVAFTTTVFSVTMTPTAIGSGGFSNVNTVGLSGFNAASWTATSTRQAVPAFWLAIGK